MTGKPCRTRFRNTARRDDNLSAHGRTFSPPGKLRSLITSMMISASPFRYRILDLLTAVIGSSYQVHRTHFDNDGPCPECERKKSTPRADPAAANGLILFHSARRVR